MAPMTNNIFTSNALVLAFSYMGITDAQSALPFTTAGVIVIVIALIWYFRNCRHFPETALVLAIFPFLFAWRGSWGYLFYFDLIILATILVYEYKDKRGTFTELSIHPRPGMLKQDKG